MKHDIVFTHADLNLRNILVDNDGKISGIVDWECASSLVWCLLGRLAYICVGIFTKQFVLQIEITLPIRMKMVIVRRPSLHLLLIERCASTIKHHDNSQRSS